MRSLGSQLVGVLNCVADCPNRPPCQRVYSDVLAMMIDPISDADAPIAADQNASRRAFSAASSNPNPQTSARVFRRFRNSLIRLSVPYCRADSQTVPRRKKEVRNAAIATSTNTTTAVLMSMGDVA